MLLLGDCRCEQRLTIRKVFSSPRCSPVLMSSLAAIPLRLGFRRAPSFTKATRHGCGFWTAEIPSPYARSALAGTIEALWKSFAVLRQANKWLPVVACLSIVLRGSIDATTHHVR